MAEAGDGPDSPADSADGRGDGESQGARGRVKDDGGSLAGDNDDATDVREPVGGRRLPARPIILAVGTVSVAVLVGGIAAATRGRGDMASPATSRPRPLTAGPSTTSSSAVVTTTSSTAPSTTTSTSPTTTTTAPPPTEAVDTSSDAQAIIPTTSAPSRTTCGPYPWPASGGNLPPVDVPPGQAAAYGPPRAACSDIAEGCSVSFTLRWSDGHTEARSRVLTSHGTYTLSGDRGTVWNFVVGTDLVCSSSGGTYSNVWPGGT
jgi:hypothetical protein